MKRLYPLLIGLLLVLSTTYQHEVPFTQTNTTSYKERVIPFTEKLYAAAESGDIEAIEQMLRTTVDMDMNEVLAETILQSPHNPLGTETKIIQALMSQNIAINQTIIPYNSTPLLLDAQLTGNGMEILIDNGARISVHNDRGAAVLSAVAKINRPSLIMLLLDNGADPRALTADGLNPFIHMFWPNTPLFSEITVTKVSFLLNAGVNPNVIIPGTQQTLQAFLIERSTPPDSAIRQTIELIAQNNLKNHAGSVIWSPYPNIEWKSPPTPIEYQKQVEQLTEELYKVATGRSTEDINRLIDAAQDIDLNDLLVETIIQSMHNPYGPEELIVQELLSRNIDVNYTKNNSTPLLMDSYITGNVVKMLIEHGADVNAVDEDNGSTALIHISSKGKIDLVKLLLENGADVNAQSNNGFTPLLAAIMPWFQSYTNDTVETIQVLLAAGASTHVTLENGRTMIQYLNDLYEGKHPIVNQIIELLTNTK